MLQTCVMVFGAILSLIGLVLLLLQKFSPSDHEIGVMGVKIKMSAPPSLIVFLAGVFILSGPMIFPAIFKNQTSMDTKSVEGDQQSSLSSSISPPPAIATHEANTTQVATAKTDTPHTIDHVSKSRQPQTNVPLNRHFTCRTVSNGQNDIADFVVLETLVTESYKSIDQTWNIIQKNESGSLIEATLSNDFKQKIKIDFSKKKVFYSDGGGWNGDEFCKMF